MSRTAVWPRWPSLLLFALAIGLLAISAEMASGEEAGPAAQNIDKASIEKHVENSVDRTFSPQDLVPAVTSGAANLRSDKALIAGPPPTHAVRIGSVIGFAPLFGQLGDARQKSDGIDLTEYAQPHCWLSTWLCEQTKPLRVFDVTRCAAPQCRTICTPGATQCVTKCGADAAPCSGNAPVAVTECKCKGECNCSLLDGRDSQCQCGSKCQCDSARKSASHCSCGSERQCRAKCDREASFAPASGNVARVAVPQHGPYQLPDATTIAHEELIELVKENTALKAQQEVRQEYTDSLVQALVENAKLKAQVEFAAEKEEFYEAAVEVMVENAALKAQAELVQQQRATFHEFVTTQQEHTTAMAEAYAENAKLKAQLDAISDQHGAIKEFVQTQKDYAKQIQQLQALLQAAQQQIHHVDHVQQENAKLKTRLAELEKELKAATQATVQPIAPAVGYPSSTYEALPTFGRATNRK